MNNEEWKAEFKRLGVERVRRKVLTSFWTDEKKAAADDWLGKETTRYQRRAFYISIMALIVSIAALIVSLMAVALNQPEVAPPGERVQIRQDTFGPLNRALGP